MISLCPSAQICLHLSAEKSFFNHQLKSFFQFDTFLRFISYREKNCRAQDSLWSELKNEGETLEWNMHSFEKTLRSLEKESLVIIEDLSLSWEEWEWLTLILEKALAVRYIFSVSMLSLSSENWESLDMIPYRDEVFYGYRRQ